MTEKVTKLALVSRLIVFVVHLLANATLPDHKPDVFRSPVPLPIATSGNATTEATKPQLLDKIVVYAFGGLRHWDGEYFLHIAEHGYSYEQSLAFYPLYPMLVRTLAGCIHYAGLNLSLRSCCLLAAVLLNLLLFCKAANCLYALTQRIFNDLNKSWNAALLFCFNPASIFFTAAYSETLFAWLSLLLMLECAGEMRWLRTTAALALGLVGRSNGLVNVGFPIYFMLRKFLTQPAQRVLLCVKLLGTILCALVPVTIYCFYAFHQYCDGNGKVITHPAHIVAYAKARDYILAEGKRSNRLQSPWCESALPFPYSYIQSHYWHVGFMRYYRFKQLPNFLLALPVLTFLLYHCYAYLRQFVRAIWPKYTLLQLLKEFKSLPFVLHALFLTCFCTLYVHIQVSTRLLCSATPCLYWFGADHLPKTFDQIRLRTKAGMLLFYFGSYYLVGTILFSNNLPWT